LSYLAIFSRSTDYDLLIGELRGTHLTVPVDTSKHRGDFRHTQRSRGTPSAFDLNGSSAGALQRKQDEMLMGKRGKSKKGKVNQTPTRRRRSRKFRSRSLRLRPEV
jgi:hypothetical protein